MSPAEPVGPPPSSLNVVSMGAMVWPDCISKIRPRQTSRPPSVTMKAGTFRKAMMKPWKAPMNAPRAMPTTRAMIQVYGWLTPTLKMLGIQIACTMAIV